MLTSKEVGRGVEIYKDDKLIAKFSVLDQDVSNKLMMLFKNFFSFIYRKYFKRY
jgi:hypothetical protein